LDSQRLQSPTSHDANLATCKTRLETIVKQLQDNYAKWQLAHQRGTSICYTIEAKKTKCLEKSQDESSSFNTFENSKKHRLISQIRFTILNIIMLLFL